MKTQVNILGGALILASFSFCASSAVADGPAAKARPAPALQRWFDRKRSAPTVSKPLPSSQGEPTAPLSTQGITVERLWDHWAARGHAGSSQASREATVDKSAAPATNADAASVAPTDSDDVQPSVPAVAGEFPAFRTDGEPTVASASPSSVELPSDEPLPTTVEAPPAVVVSASEEPARPAPLRIPQGTTSYLNDKVRYGAIVRTQAESSILDPAAGILGDTDDARPLKPIPMREKPRESEPSKKVDVQRLELLKPAAEDLTDLGTLQPSPATDSFGWQAASERKSGSAGSTTVSASASPSALQRVVQSWGTTPADLTNYASNASFTAPVSPQKRSSKAPTRARQASQGSVLGVDDRTGTVHLDFNNQVPAVGSRVKVYQRVLFAKQLLGELEVTRLEQGVVIARPIGKVDLQMIVRGDEALVF